MAQPKKRLGELLVDAGVIDEFQLKSALADQKRWGDKLGSTLVKLGFVTEEIMAKALSSQMKIPNVNLRTTDIPMDVYEVIPAEKAKKLGVIPVMMKKEGAKKLLYLAMSDPTNLAAIDEIQFLTGNIVKPVIAMDSQIVAAIDRYYFGNMDEMGGEGAPPGAIDSVHMRMAREKASREPAPEMEITRGATSYSDGASAAPEAPLDLAGGDPGRPKPSKEMLALLRLLSRKGLITKEEFIEEFKNL